MKSGRERVVRQHQLRMVQGVYYVWCGGSCDYSHEERCSGGAFIMQKDDNIVETYTISDTQTTEFRMILQVMIHTMKTVPQGSDIIFLTNVSYIQQNYDRTPNAKSANADLINECIQLKDLHNSVAVKLVPFHKYHLLGETHTMAHKAMTQIQEMQQQQNNK